MTPKLFNLRSMSGWMAGGICLAVALLAWSGYAAVREWRRSAMALTQRRTNDAADLLLVALQRDMRGVEESVLQSSQWNPEMIGSGYAMTRLLASAFARYPYPEMFFGWRGRPTASSLTLFNRTDRLPRWLSAECGGDQFPINTCRDPTIAGRLASLLAPPADGTDVSIVETTFAGEPYQLVTRFVYGDPFREQLLGGLGFAVNLTWVRHEYIQRFAAQVAPVAGISNGLALSIIDDAGRHVVGTASPEPAGGPASRRSFALLFADPLLNHAAEAHSRHRWTLEVRASETSAASDPFWLDNRLRALFATAFGAGALALGLAVRAHTARSTARLAHFRSEFVASLTHELKTPIASIHALGGAIASRRVSDEDAIREYAALVVAESKKLARLVDNSLAYARITDAADMLRMEALDVQALFDDALARFGAILKDRQFTVTLDVPPDLPSVRADQVAMALLIDNVIDNAVRYADASPRLDLSARAHRGAIEMAIADNGAGIPEDELPHVTEKFFRGRGAAPGGTGLGLAIVALITGAHRGTLRIESAVGTGTAVRVTLPAAE